MKKIIDWENFLNEQRGRDRMGIFWGYTSNRNPYGAFSLMLCPIKEFPELAYRKIKLDVEKIYIKSVEYKVGYEDDDQALDTVKVSDYLEANKNYMEEIEANGKSRKENLIYNKCYTECYEKIYLVILNKKTLYLKTDEYTPVSLDCWSVEPYGYPDKKWLPNSKEMMMDVEHNEAKIWEVSDKNKNGGFALIDTDGQEYSEELADSIRKYVLNHPRVYGLLDLIKKGSPNLLWPIFQNTVDQKINNLGADLGDFGF